MSQSRCEMIGNACKLISEAIDLLEKTRNEEEAFLESLPTSSRGSERACQIKDVVAHLEEAIGDLVNVEEWLEYARI